MNRSSAVAMLVFVGMAIGAGIAAARGPPSLAAASSDPIGTAMSGLAMASLAIVSLLVVVAVVASFAIGLGTVVRWPREYQVSVLIGLLLIGFLGWLTWMGGPIRVTSDMQVIDPHHTAEERTLIRGGAVGLLVLSSLLLAWLLTGRSPSACSNRLNGQSNR